VGETGATLGLRSDADVVDDRHADDRRRPVRCEDDPQAVGEGEPLAYRGDAG
jgi:hypothetical protein